ncbi:MAG TPA: ferritin family protein, partial [Smithella sp.]|nr:ferritin family protein [Smithella sp.]HOS13887.1 ferritin family protein [Smithella sp.]HPL47525.1 ferritin family protein [Smithella sp.]
MVKLYRCIICGDAYIGASPPANCPFCGAHMEYIMEAKDAVVNFDVPLSAKDRANAEHALKVEISNATFYSCAAGKTDDPEGKVLFKALGKIEAEHASIWKKILKLASLPPGNETCHTENVGNLKESHARETRAIEFYRKSAAEADHPRIRQLFEALVEI